MDYSFDDKEKRDKDGDGIDDELEDNMPHIGPYTDSDGVVHPFISMPRGRKKSNMIGENAANTRFPHSPDDLLPNLPRDKKGRIYPSDKIRIRAEKHPIQDGEDYAPRHHGQHYHVEIRKDTDKSWNNKKNVIKIKPEDYESGKGTGFVPGEKFPGESVQ
jgi:hypothetical protein